MINIFLVCPCSCHALILSSALRRGFCSIAPPKLLNRYRINQIYTAIGKKSDAKPIRLRGSFP